jgi:hypothetical protein
VPALAALAVCLGGTCAARAQVVSDAERGGLIVTVGAMGTGETLQYGNRHMLGITGFVDAETHRSFGLEAEARMLEWHQTTDVHLETYSIGGRYHLNFGRYEPYAKGLVGLGYFNFPYNLATGSYMVVTAGGGVDIRLNRRIYFRAADFEYQDWPQFSYGAMSTASVSSGIRVRVF